MSIPTRVGHVAYQLLTRGVTVVEVPGWEDRGAGPMDDIRGMVMHHTASPRDAGNAASLRVVTFGRADLRNSLCMWHVARDGTVHLVAAGVSWHAGRSRWLHDRALNRIYAGVEAEHDGAGEPWTPASIAAQEAIDVEMAREFGFEPDETVAEHREVAVPYGRKTDRAGVSGPAWRARVAAALDHEEDDDMLFITTDATKLVWLVAGGARVRLPHSRFADELDPGWRKKLKVLSSDHPLMRLPEA